jgi:hypothetical protein
MLGLVGKAYRMKREILSSRFKTRNHLVTNSTSSKIITTSKEIVFECGI